MRRAVVGVGACLIVLSACASSGSSADTLVPWGDPPAASVPVPAIDIEALLVRGGDPRGSERHDLTYTDVTGAERTVVIEVRMPKANRTTSPVVVWSHGGSAGKRSPARVGTEWGKAMNQADFVFVAIAHPGRSDATRRELCTALEVESCGEFKYLLWDRLRDAQVVFDWLERAAAAGTLFVDLDRLVYGGHSAGAMAVMVMAGMDSPYATGVPMPTDDRPAAFLAASPPGAEVNGLSTASIAGLDRPMLLLTGQGDTTGGTIGSDRLALFDLIDSDQVLLASTDSEHVGHATFDLNARPCIRAGGSETECRDMIKAFGRTAQAFLRAALGAGGLDAAGLVEQSMTRLPDDVELRSAA